MTEHLDPTQLDEDALDDVSGGGNVLEPVATRKPLSGRFEASGGISLKSPKLGGFNASALNKLK